MTTEGTRNQRKPGEGRFVLQAEAGHSAYWRRDKSSVGVVDLAKLLRSIRKLVSHVGRNAGTVVWEGMLAKEGDICLDPAQVSGSYPVPGSKVDVAVGLAIQKAYRATEWGEHVNATALAQSTLSPVYHYKFALYVEMAERVYADIIANRTVLGLYSEKAREWEIERARRQFVTPPTFTELLHDWWQLATGKTRPSAEIDYHDRSMLGMTGSTALDQYYAKPLAFLRGVADELTEKCWWIGSVADRCEYRRRLYVSTFEELLNYVKFWPGDRKDPFLLSAGEQQEVGAEGESQRVEEAMPRDDAAEIEHRLAGRRVDFTEQVKSMVANFGDVARVEGEDLVMPARDAVDHALAHKLGGVLQSVAQRNITYNRGLASGSIDPKRLYRAPTTGLVFNLKLRRYELYNDVALLVDCTGSMAEPTKWSRLEVVYQTIFSALVRYSRNARLFGYSERGGTCRLTELHRQGRFYSVMPHGKTASGEAILATALTLRRQSRRPLIIHITDGASNWGCGVPEAVRHCKQMRIGVVTLGLCCDPLNMTALQEEYRELIRFLTDVDKLPETLRSLLASRRYDHLPSIRRRVN